MAGLVLPTALLVIAVVVLGAFLLYIFFVATAALAVGGDEQLLEILARCWARRPDHWFGLVGRA
ncbi:MAG: hypothetical protein WA728_28235 [Xanthobacteraceae bacterium]